MNKLPKFDLKTPSAILTAVACLGLLALMLVVAMDVVLRISGVYFIFGVTDYISLAQILLIACAIPAAFLEGRHLVVEIGTYNLSPANKARLEAVWLLLGAPVLAMLAQLVLQEGIYMDGRGRTMGIMGWSMNAYHVPVAIGMLLSALGCLYAAFRKLT